MSREIPPRVLPAHPSLEHLRKEAKQQLGLLRKRAASAQLTDAQLLVARTYGFTSWRALKLEVDARRTALGLAPPLILADMLPGRRPAARRAWVPDAEQAEQGFFLCALSLMSGQLAVPIGVLIAALLH
jgi:hypothetical protein